MAEPTQPTHGASCEDAEQPALPWANRQCAADDSTARNSDVERCQEVDNAADDGEEDMAVGDLEQALSAARPIEAVGLKLRDKVEVGFDSAQTRPARGVSGACCRVSARFSAHGA